MFTKFFERVIFRIYRDEKFFENDSHPRLLSRNFLSFRSLLYLFEPLRTRSFSDEFLSTKSCSPRRHEMSERRAKSTTTYQDSHFCSHDVPGASRSELDADCRRFLALYTRHTFAFATRGPVGSEAPSCIPPRYTSLFSYDDDGPTVPSDHHSPLGQTFHSPSLTNTRAA